MSARSMSIEHPRFLTVNMLRLLACIEKNPLESNGNSMQRLREQIDALHRMKLTAALPDGLDLDSVDRRVDAILELGRSTKLAQHQIGEIESPSCPPGSLGEVFSSFSSCSPAAATAMPDNNESGMRLALLTPKGAPSRKKMVKFKHETSQGGSVSMQILRSESITKMNNELKNVMRDIQTTATKVCVLCIARMANHFCTAAVSSLFSP
jgi:hypothetical protein